MTGYRKTLDTSQLFPLWSNKIKQHGGLPCGMGIPVSAPQMINFPRWRDAGKRQIIEPKILQRLNRTATASVRIK